MPECARDHGTLDHEMPRKEHALLSEGICPDCEQGCVRDAEGYAVCPCCSMGFILRDGFVYARLPFVLVDDEQVHNGGYGTDQNA